MFGWGCFTVGWWWFLADSLLALIDYIRCCSWASFGGVGFVFVGLGCGFDCGWVLLVWIADDCFYGWWLFNNVDMFCSLL